MTEGTIIVIKGDEMASVYCHGGMGITLATVLESFHISQMTAKEILEEALRMYEPDWFKEPVPEDRRIEVFKTVVVPRGFLIVADCNTKLIMDMFGDQVPKGWTRGKLTLTSTK